ncbi:transglycosylase SLT domain-containing protein [Streptomyces griseus]|uniref:Transglycosylase SLT domain-containing protein n=1 Tax=Streptomyces griseus subsp. griseus (strain JCM 4626 / CBS 651.72 / NBRC 13350 / KCC S-0626 / ISP 5235) TaxID=455632 RepID=B1VN44_STRGG|nr:MULTISPECIES: transglycosylase SLT domain-containing protein [Streptomyces]MYR15279.1 transglycosylase SLT domain-containing protein [Streptomyces sp. SID724]MYR54490.1 transglycosylase SLT domain-containing protein [Streptomyces sp. SID4928]MYT82041.1 transglycosylase SLT domain-containing protein [Streptomyces sp. SID8364]EGE46487.1 Lytic transglycosylase catalytic [Streptomyces sp. ACT-1]MBW3709443.1 lytic transglycosylase [Streptomyces griseus]
MPRISTLRITRSHKIATAVLVAAGSVSAIAATGGPSEAQTTATRSSISVEPVAAAGIPTAKDAAAKKAAQETAAKEAAAKKAAAARKAAAEKDAAEARSEKQAANRSTERKAVTPKKFANNLDGWIRESLDIMKKKNIPGSYEGLHRNIMRESSGNPNAVNDWDINARNGIPSKGLLQVIQPTFDAYHVKGTPKKLTDPVANITAAANYAADRYGSIDNVDSAY